MRYVPNTDSDRRAMLEAIGRTTVTELFSDIPQSIRERFRPAGLRARSELELVSELRRLAEANVAAARVPFLGGGIYDHYVPSIVPYVLSRSEFYTSYTPYQPEVSQGTLTAMFEFQTFVCELTGMEIANASMYDGATALAEAVLMAERICPRRRVAVARTLHPHVRRVLDTYSWAAEIDIVELPYGRSGQCDLTDIPTDVSAVVLQTPNAFGVIEPLVGVKEQVGEALLVVCAYPLALGVLEPPGAFGADIVVGEGQSLGLPMAFGGPLLGLFATRKAYLRQMPGRVAGRTLDADGNVGFTMAVQTREQHIRRERATSNICTNSGLNALAATVYLASVGEAGLRSVAEMNLEKAHYLAERITALEGFGLAFDGPFFNEFVVRLDEEPHSVFERLSAAGFLIDGPNAVRSLGVDGALRFAVTEKRTREQLDRLVAVLRGEET
jgi:glycine dehydrogenase subunit 1